MRGWDAKDTYLVSAHIIIMFRLIGIKCLAISTAVDNCFSIYIAVCMMLGSCLTDAQTHASSRFCALAVHDHVRRLEPCWMASGYNRTRIRKTIIYRESVYYNYRFDWNGSLRKFNTKNQRIVIDNEVFWKKNWFIYYLFFLFVRSF